MTNFIHVPSTVKISPNAAAFDRIAVIPAVAVEPIRGLFSELFRLQIIAYGSNERCSFGIFRSFHWGSQGVHVGG